MKFILTICLTFFTTIVSADQNVAIVLDNSSSMDARVGNVSRMALVKRSLTNVVKDLPSDTKIGIVLLNGGWNAADWLVPMTLLDTSRQEVIAKIEQVRPNGGTPLGGAMKAGADGLLALRNKERYGTYRMLIVTDGEAQDQSLVDGYLPEIRSRGISVDTIGVDIPGGHTLATKVNNYSDARDESTLVKAIQATFAETTGTDSQGDYELLEGLPDDFAEAAIVSLGEIRSDPIHMWEKPQYYQYPAVDAQGDVVKPAKISGVTIFFIVVSVVFVFFLISASLVNH